MHDTKTTTSELREAEPVHSHGDWERASTDASSSVSVMNQKYDHLKTWNCKLQASLNQNQPDNHEIIPLTPGSMGHMHPLNLSLKLKAVEPFRFWSWAEWRVSFPRGWIPERIWIP